MGAWVAMVSVLRWIRSGESFRQPKIQSSGSVSKATRQSVAPFILHRVSWSSSNESTDRGNKPVVTNLCPAWLRAPRIPEPWTRNLIFFFFFFFFFFFKKSPP